MSSMQPETKPYLTPEEYLAIERRAERKSEYFRGEMFMLAGTSRWHAAISTNLIRAIGNALHGRGCGVYGSDLRIKVTPLGKYTYPDVAVVCGPQQFEDNNGDTLLNPTVIIEVLSPSTERYDRGTKFEHYRSLESLREYILVAQDHPHVDLYRRMDDGTWTFTDANGTQGMLPIASIGCELSLADIYEGIDFPNPPFGFQEAGAPAPEVRS